MGIEEIQETQEKELEGHMEQIVDLLKQEQARMDELIEKTSRQLKNAPEGTLRISVDRGKERYYYCTKEDSLGNYIQKKDRRMAEKLAQKEYNQRIFASAKKMKCQISRLLSSYEKEGIEECYYRLHRGKRKLVTPVEPVWEELEREWIEEEYDGKIFQEEGIEIITQRGERVRSKSEKILADCFNYYDIPYKYEKPLYLNGYGIVYPDFTFLSKRIGKEIYWEHHGMMDSPAYAESAVRKIHCYERNGIFPGERLILTFETQRDPLNTEIVQILLEKYIL